MNSVYFNAAAPPSVGTHAVITRVDDLRWRAVADERNSAATALFEGFAAKRVSGAVDMVRSA